MVAVGSEMKVVLRSYGDHRHPQGSEDGCFEFMKISRVEAKPNGDWVKVTMNCL